MPIPTTDAPAAKAAEFMAHQVWEGMELWTSGCRLWFDYLSALPTVQSPTDLMDLNNRFMARTLSMPGFAMGALLKDAGLPAPVLSDA